MSMMVSFVLSFFPRDVLDEVLNLIESVSEDFPSYSCLHFLIICPDLYFYFISGPYLNDHLKYFNNIL